MLGIRFCMFEHKNAPEPFLLPENGSEAFVLIFLRKDTLFLHISGHYRKLFRQRDLLRYFFSNRFGAVRLPSKPDFGMGFAVCSDLGAL
mgnify:CR=1 FL=1